MSFKGKQHTEEFKAKMSARRKGMTVSEQALNNMSKGQKGHSVSDTTIEACIRNKNWTGRKVIISGVEYKSMLSAAKALGIKYHHMVGMCRYNPEDFAKYGLHLDWVETK